jgi:hypothetical protein
MLASPEFEGDELISSIKEEANKLASMIDDVEREFMQKGDSRNAELLGYVRRSGLLFDAHSYVLDVDHKFKAQLKTILRLLGERFPWAPITDDILRNEVVASVLQYDENPVAGAYAVFERQYCLVGFRDLVDPDRQDEFLRELFKPVHVCVVRMLNSSSGTSVPLDKLKEYDTRVLREAIAMAEKKKWIVRQADGTVDILERPWIEIACPSCHSRISADEDQCPSCGFYVPNLALRTKRRLDVPKKWYEQDQHRNAWIAYFRHSPKLSDSIEIGELVTRRTHIYVTSVIDSALTILENEKTISRLPDHEHEATYYTEFLWYMLDREEHPTTYSTSARSKQDLRAAIAEVTDELRAQAGLEYEEQSRLLEETSVKKEDFVEEFIRHAMNHFVPRLDRHPVVRENEPDEIGKWLDRRIELVRGYIRRIAEGKE